MGIYLNNNNNNAVRRRIASATRRLVFLMPLMMLLALSAQHVLAQESLGGTGDIRINGDFDGDGNLDYAIWRPINGSWYIYESSNSATLITKQWGLPGDIPVPGDYFGDHQTSYAVWRPAYGLWLIMSSKTGTVKTQQWGLPGDIPVPADYDGDGITDMAVYRPSNGTWYVLLSGSNNAPMVKQLGQPGDAPFTGDFDGDGKSDMVVYRYGNGNFYQLSSTSSWNTISQTSLGMSFADIPFVGDFDGDGRMDYAVWRPYDTTITGWSGFNPGAVLHITFSKGGSTYYQSLPPSELFATNFKVPGFDNTVCRVYNRIEGDFDGDGVPDFALFDSQTDRWFIVPSTDPGHPIQQTWGVSAGDIPVPADYFGSGHADLAVWSPSNGNWYVTSNINNVADTSSWLYTPAHGIPQFGGPGVDIPQPGDYDGDGRADLAVWRPALGTWYIETSTFTTQYTQQWGLPGDIPVAADYEGDSHTHYAVYRPSLGSWYVVPSPASCSPNCTGALPQQWGLPIGDQPVIGDFNGDGKADYIIWRPTMGAFFGLSVTGSPSGTLSVGVASNGLLLNDPPITPSFGDLFFGTF
jgi:hypothetical protein